MNRARGTLLVLVTGTVLATSGCDYGGLNSVVLPGGAGTGADSYVVSAEFATASNLVPNSEIKVDDVTVGTVRSITRDGWHAKITMGLKNAVQLPANVVATVGQKSLLGAAYVQLTAPTDEPATGRLLPNAAIPLERTNKYPETEELLAALSLWLNGGGLGQVQTISTELNKALAGNEPAVRDLITNLNTFAGTLDAQKTQVVGSIDALDRLSATLAAHRDKIGVAIDKIGPGVAALNENRGSLTDALAALNRFSTVGNRVISSSGDDLRSNLHDLQPVVAKLSQAGADLPKSLDLLGTFLFPISATPSIVKGDFLSAVATVDLSIPGIANGLLPGTPPGQALQALQTALQAGDPIAGPLSDAANGVTGSFSVGGTSGGLITPHSHLGQPLPAAPTSQPAPSNPPGDVLGGLLEGN
jgi:phospholipid/cholesterol/gamma-HCH transport system substrate-binding protein